MLRLLCACKHSLEDAGKRDDDKDNVRAIREASVRSSLGVQKRIENRLLEFLQGIVQQHAGDVGVFGINLQHRR